MGARGQGTRFSALVLAGLVAAASGCNRSCSCEREPMGPMFEDLPPDKGLLTLRFPNAPPDWDATVVVFDHVTPDAHPTGFPMRVAVPLGKRGVVEASADGRESFRQGFMLTPDHRETEIVIRLGEARSSCTYGFASSDLPAETGFMPLTKLEPGQPDARLFEDGSSAQDDMSPETWSASSLIIDERGNVWRRNRTSAGATGDWLKLGSVDPAVLARMRTLVDKASTGELTAVPGCQMCEPDNRSLYVYPGAATGSTGTTIARDCQRLQSPAATALAAWVVAIRKQAVSASR